MKKYLNAVKAKYFYTLGCLLRDRREFDKALSCYQAAIRFGPHFLQAYDEAARLFLEKNQLSDAFSYLHSALALDANFASAHWNLARALLLAGDYRQGFREYEWRWEKFTASKRHFPQPRWDGADLAGRTILVHAEQGLGDCIQFVRYVPLLKEHGAGHVIFECHGSLINLMRGVRGIDIWVERGHDLPSFDVHSPLISLPHLLGTTVETIPATIPYFTLSEEQVAHWAEQFSHDQNLKIGVVWAGSRTHANDYKRSCALRDFAPLAQLSGVAFYSLQKDELAKQLCALPGMRLINLAPYLTDFSVTAAIVANLDLVISVDTAVAHLAGALGRPVWTLLPFAPDYRWMLEREDTPWYPTMRLFRQKQPGVWLEVFQRIATEIASGSRQSVSLSAAPSFCQ